MTTEPLGFDDYLGCALWSSTHYEDEHDENGTPFDDVDAEFNTEARAQLATEFQDFLDGIEPLRENEAYAEIFPDDEQIGHDFWLTRNGHGAGFWDRGLGKLGDKLTEAAKTYGSCDLYLGDNGELYAQ